MVEFKGGRGNKAPYKTVVARVPEDISILVEAIANTYRELKALGKENEIQEFIGRVESAIVSVAYSNVSKLPTLDEARNSADKILSQKKSAKVSVEKLLQVLYSKEDESNSLKKL